MKVTCSAGYIGTAAVAACTADGEAYTLSGCEQDPICLAPDNVKGYLVTEASLQKSKWDVTAQCALGYLGQAAVAPCTAHGEKYSISGCELDPICLAPTSTKGYKFKESELAKSKFDVDVECAYGYVGKASVSACTSHGGAFSLSGCEVDPVCVAPKKLERGYKVKENSLTKSNFDVEVECATGFLGTASVTPCTADGEEYEIAGCEIDPVCLAPTGAASRGYKITEKSIVKSTWDVTAECASGYVGTAEVTICAADGERYSLSGCEVDPVCLAPTLKAGYKVVENSLLHSQFSVEAECIAGYLGTPVVTECEKDGEQYSISGCELDPVCLAPKSLGCC